MYEKLFSPTYLKELCETYTLRPSKKYGQNYLISQKPIEAMVEAADLKKNDIVVEIGPGFGVLTLAVAPHVQSLVAFEIEKTLYPYWEKMQEEFSNIDVVWGNALKTLPEHEVAKGDFKVLANLPYQITSHAIRTLLELVHKPERIIVMVQKEVADRMCAKAGEMSLLSLSVQYYGNPSIVLKVPKGNFWPAPKVDSAIVSIQDIHTSKEVFNDDQFFTVAKAGFSSKRKQLWKNVSSQLDLDGNEVKSILEQITNNSAVRAQELSCEQWKQFVHKLYS